MGTKYGFQCPKCGYKAIVSGGRDYGFVAVIRTMICVDCNDLVDVVIGREGNDGPTGNVEYDKNLNSCPKCRGLNVYSWSAKRSCPRCKEKMVRSKEAVLLWD
jgi:uncharacterized paraquat-inducible protein A